MGKVATSPLLSGGCRPFQSGGKNQKLPTSGQSGYVTPAVSGIPTASERGEIQKLPACGQSGYITPAVSGIPTASERGKKSDVAHKWAKWLHHPCRLGGPTVAERGAKSEVAHKWAKWLHHPCCLGDPHRFRAGGKIRSGPQVGTVATSPLPSRGSPALQSGVQNQKWPACGQSGYITPLSRGSPLLQSGGENQKWPTSEQSGYVTPAVSVIPTASELGEKSEVAHSWPKSLRHPCRLGDPHRCRAGGKIRSGQQVGKVAESPLPSRGSPPLQSVAKNQKWPTSGHSGYVTLAVSGIPTASERGGKSDVAQKWAKWLHHPCRLGDPHHFRAGGKIRGGPLVGTVATSLLPSRGSPPLQSGGENQKWRTSGQSGYVTPAVWGIPTASERGEKSEVAHSWAKWLRHACCLRDPHRCRAGGKIRSGPQVGKVATSSLPFRGSPPLQSGGQNQTWATSGQSGYVRPAVSRIPTASERGAKSEVAPLWANWLLHPCRLADLHRFRAGRKIRFEVWSLILRVLDAFRPRGATWSGQVISSPPGPRGGPSKTHLLPGGGVPWVHRARSPVLLRRPRIATPRSVHQFAAVAAGAYPLRRPPNAWSPGAPALPGPCYWLVASGTPLGWRGGCLA